MRIYQEGFELDSSVSTEFSITQPLLPIANWVGSLASGIFVTTTTPHTNPNGDGGIRSLGIGGINLDRRHFFGPKLPIDLKYGWIGFAMKVPSTGESRFGISVIEGGFTNTAKQIDINLSFTGVASIRLAGTTIATGTTILSNGWHWFAVEYYCHPSLGFINLYIDDISEIQYNGADTQGIIGVIDWWNEVQVSLDTDSQVDDIVINTATIHYTGGVGTPTIGATVTGGTSSATAVITAYSEVSAGEGYLTLQPNLGDTTGPTGFQLAEGLSDGSGWTATSAQVAIDANGLDKNSGRPAENFLVLLRPTSDVSVQLTGQDADMIDNFLNVSDATFGTTSTYNEGITSGFADIYGLENIPFSPDTIDAVEIIVYGARAGTIPGLELGIDPGLGVTYSPSKPVGSGGSFAKGSEILDINPDTDAAWTESEVNASDIAVRLA